MAGTVAEPRYQQYKDQGFQAYFFIAEDVSGQPPSPAYCKSVRQQFGLTMPVLIGDTAAVAAALGMTGSPNEWQLVIDQGGALLYRDKYNSASQVDSVIENAL